MSILSKLNDIKSVITVITVVIGCTGTVLGGVFWVDDRYAKAEAVEEIKKDVTLIELKDQLREAQEEYYFLKKQARMHPGDEELAEELAEAKETVDDLKKLIKELKKKKALE